MRAKKPYGEPQEQAQQAGWWFSFDQGYHDRGAWSLLISSIGSKEGDQILFCAAQNFEADWRIRTGGLSIAEASFYTIDDKA
jgi:hypothetical protein